MVSVDSFNTKRSFAASGIELLARVGYLSRGIIYFVIGSMAGLAAVGSGGGTEDAKGALRTLLSLPGGWVIVGILALGLSGYSIWRLCQAIADTDSHGSDVKGLAIRGGMLASGIGHAALALWAARAASGLIRSGGESTSQETVSWLMSQPYGRWLVAILGLIIMGVGVAQFSKGYKRRYERYLQWEESVREKLSPVCQFGLYARGLVFLIIGSFSLYAAVTTDPQQAGGLHDALDWLRQQSYGLWMLGTCAIGLVAFGVYSVVEAQYRTVYPPARGFSS